MEPSHSIVKKSVLVCAVAATCAASAFSASYTGNGNTSFGGAIGQGMLSLTDDGTTLTGTFTKGGGDFFDDFVIYIDSVPVAGVDSTSGLTDTADRGREAVSGFNGTDRATLNFTSGFGADYAIALRGEGGSGSLFNLTNSANFTFVTSVNFSDASNPGTAPDKGTAVDTFSISLASLGLAPGAGQSLSFITTYLNGVDAFRAGESIGNDYVNTTFDGGNVGRNTANINAANTFTTTLVPEPGVVSLSAAACFGLLGFRFLRRRLA